MDWEKSYDGKIVIVTGGASGIGKALCEKLGRLGAVVIVTDIDEEGAKAVASNVKKQQGGKAFALKLDVTNENAFKKLIDGTVRKHKRLDYIFNSAGVTINGDMQDLTMDHFRKAIDVDMYGVLYGTKYAYQAMIGQKSGHIVNIASLVGLTPSVPYNIPYAMAKHAVVCLSRSLRAEGRPLGVKVSVVCPGFVETDMLVKSSTIINGKEVEVDMSVFKKLNMVKVDRAIKIILKGVCRNKETIIFPSRLVATLGAISFVPSFKKFRSQIEQLRQIAERN
ncbi:MAG: SDR family oxidoreductase [Clostridia bacterium]|nr:SDR family oxidoreductase [Clostridia bacterium]